MPRICQVTGKKTSFGNKIARRGMAKSKGGVGIKLTGITRRKFQPNLQRIRVLLPNGTVRRMRVATSVIRNGWITAKIDGKVRRVPLVKAVRGRNRPYVPPTPPELEAAAAEAAGEQVVDSQAPEARSPAAEETGSAGADESEEGGEASEKETPESPS